jgi:hypothetical protein
MSSLEQFLFSPSALSNAASLSTTIDELAAGMLAGSITNSEFASFLTGASYLGTPERTYPYGDRMLSVTGNVGLSYAPSDRSSISFGVSAGRSQRLQRKDSAATDAIIPNTTGGSANLGWTYAVSPRMQVGISAGTTRSFSRFQDGYISRVDFSASRTLSPRLFVQGRFGGGFMQYTRQTFVVPTGVDYSAGGGVGFKTRSHTFLASIDRTLSDGYGLGAGSTMSISGAWNWRRRNSPWMVSGSSSYQRLQGSILGPLESWTSTLALARSLGTHLFIGIQYGYSELPALLSQPALSQSGATASLTWSPAARQ